VPELLFQGFTWSPFASREPMCDLGFPDRLSCLHAIQGSLLDRKQKASERLPGSPVEQNRPQPSSPSPICAAR